MSRRKQFAFGLFALVAIILFTLFLGWNLVIVQYYQQVVELARRVSNPQLEQAPWGSLILSTLGFLIIMGGLVQLFLRLLEEMKLNQRQSEFLASMSHELKTPLATLELSASLLKSGGLTEDEQTELWASHDAELSRLKQEVEAILESARMESKHFQAKKTKIIIEGWLEESFQRWRQMLGPKAVIQREGAALPFEAHVDPRLLNMITDNLLDNARKFARGIPRVTIRSKMIEPHAPKQPRRWQIQFRDEGWGFSAAEAKRIFNRFYRGKTGAPHAVPGTGLGLHLAKTASQELGIDLKAESAVSAKAQSSHSQE